MNTRFEGDPESWDSYPDERAQQDCDVEQAMRIIHLGLDEWLHRPMTRVEAQLVAWRCGITFPSRRGER
jgi:hypothetical protein